MKEFRGEAQVPPPNPPAAETPAAAHTPGPWHWDSDPIKDDPLGRVRYRVVAKGKTITQCYYSSGDPNAEADARLIAAAPETLDILNLAFFCLQGPCGEAFRDVHPATWRQMQAAIAKAEDQ